MFLKTYFKNKKAIILVALISFILLESLVIAFIVYTQKDNTTSFLNITTPDTKSHIDLTNAQLTNISKIFYDITINKPEVIEIIYKASHTKDKQQLSLLRDELFHKLTPTYNYMKKYHVRQLHFQLPNAVSFLRFHKPSKYGDSLIGIRDTLEYVNEYKTPINAFEEGRIFNGFRNVYPIYKALEFIGTVEISFSFDAMQEILTNIDHTSYLFMIKENIVSTKVFNEEQSNYEKSEFNGFDYDKKTLKDTMQISLANMKKINNAIADDVKISLQNAQPFSIYFKNKTLYNNNSILINFIPISNLNNQIVAYIVHYEFGNFLDILLHNIEIEFWIATLLALILSAIFTMLIIHKKKKQTDIHDLSVHDALTKIYNRHGVNEILNQKLEEHKRGKKGLSVIFFDIDFFKRVNDTYGHDMGDYVLKNIAKVVNSEIRASDIFARWGGEEFILFLPDTNLYSSVEVAQKIRISIQKHAFSQIEQITCSFGVTELRKDDTKTSFLKRADVLLYKAKESGRNCVISDKQP